MKRISSAVDLLLVARSLTFSATGLIYYVQIPVFHPVPYPFVAALRPIIVPPMKVTDFSFTAIVDAI